MKKIKLEKRSKVILRNVHSRYPDEFVAPLDDAEYVEELQNNHLIEAADTQDGIYCSMTKIGNQYIKDNPSLRNPFPIRIKGLNIPIGAHGCALKIGFDE